MRKRYAAFVAALARGLTAPRPKWLRVADRASVAAQLVPRVRVDTRHGALTFHTPSKEAVYWPRHGLATEPETLAWIDGLAPGSVLWDIGAGVGVFSLYAGLRRDLLVLAFEANPFTYDCLLRNVHDNGLQEGVRPYCLALAERPGLGSLFVAEAAAGTVGNAFGDRRRSTHPHAAGQTAVAAVAVSVDALVRDFGAPFPNHVKLDVDSIEEEIIAGARATLADARLRSLLVEVIATTAVQRERAAAIVDRLQSHGLAPDPSVTSSLGNRLFVRR
jgi:FkbM family methyltransferase